MFQFTVQRHGPPWQPVKAQELEATDRLTSTIRKQRGTDASARLFPFCSLDPKLGMVPSTLRVSLPSSVYLIKASPPRCAQS